MKISIHQNFTIYALVISVLQEEVGSVVNEVEASKGHKKHYDQKLKEQENKIKELKNNMEKYQKEIEVIL